MWNDGYFIDDTYTYGYYKALSPFYQRFCLLANGYEPPAAGENAVHCELGFGQGVSINVHAASNASQYYGTDFNPAHAAHANSLGSASGANVHLYDLSFSELLARDDLPMFDSISLHGVWSWISRENQDVIVRFARRFLKPGGVFYNSYNCFPGWTPKLPLRALLSLKDVYAREGRGSSERSQAALAFAEKVLATFPALSKHGSALSDALARLKTSDPHYLAHEYLNRDWQIMYFTEVAEMLADAKLDFACTGSLIDALDELESVNMPEEAREFLLSIHHPLMREELRDFCLMRQFRGDISVRGLRPILQKERVRRLLAQEYVLLRRDSSNELEVTGSHKKIIVKTSLTEPIFSHLRADSYRPKDFRSLVGGDSGMKEEVLVGIVLAMTHSDVIAPCQDAETTARAIPFCRALNRRICAGSLYGQTINVLASPLTGRGQKFDRISQLMLHYFWENQSDRDLARHVWKTLDSQNQTLVVGGKALPDEKENMEELKRREEKFKNEDLPLMETLKIV